MGGAQKINPKTYSKKRIYFYKTEAWIGVFSNILQQLII